jgi:acyl carrier protein
MPTVPSSLGELRAKLARELEIEERQLTAEARFAGELGLSSLNAIIVVMALEEWFGLAISDEEAERLCTLSDVQNFLGVRGVDLQSTKS